MTKSIQRHQTSPSTDPSTTVKARRILKKLQLEYPKANTELHYNNTFELLVATILSAQCTDERVNKITLTLFFALPSSTWTFTSDTFIFHDRKICKPEPLCEYCSVSNNCLCHLELKKYSTFTKHIALNCRSETPATHQSMLREKVSKKVFKFIKN